MIKRKNIFGWMVLSGFWLRAETVDFRTVYINDVVHIVNCESSYQKGREPIDDAMLAASIKEVLGFADVQMLQPGFTWVPWWISSIYPSDAHYQWFSETFGLPYNRYGFDRYMMSGGDLVKTFVETCREAGTRPFISFRLNDYHYKEVALLLKEIMDGKRDVADAALFDGLLTSSCISQFYLDHRAWWLGPEPVVPVDGPLAFLKDRSYRTELRKARTMNWAVPEVRAYILSLIRELCLGYDIDGLELDFMRHAPYFDLKATSAGQRQKIMTEFVSSVRSVLDEGAKGSQRRCLGVRIPFRVNEFDKMGVDLTAFIAAGVDWVNASCNYHTEQQCDIAGICQSVPETPVFLEFTDLSQTVTGAGGNTVSRRLTDEQIYTLAHLAYSRGAYGISSFNFAYYRRFEQGRKFEPPFHVFRVIKDRAEVARQPQHYYLTDKDLKGQRIGGRVISGGEKKIHLDMAPPSGGWTQTARLRLQMKTNVPVMIKFNGVILKQTEDTSEFYRSPYLPVMTEDRLQAWMIPPGLLNDGMNAIAVIPEKEMEITYIDIGVR